MAGGMENMSLAPYLLDAKARSGYRLGDGQVYDVILRDGLMSPPMVIIWGLPPKTWLKSTELPVKCK